MSIFRLSDDPRLFPDPRFAESDGLLALGGDLSPERLLLAYQMGAFPWYGEDDPILWWSPDPRCVLIPEQINVSRRLKRVLRRGTFRITCNRAFDRVVAACADVRTCRGEQTWILPEMQRAYSELHRLGFAHSVEAWADEQLAGGLYGIAMGRFFFGESMFHTVTDASKVVLVGLARHLASNNFEFLDCQVPNAHLMRMGACNLSRGEFLDRLHGYRKKGGDFGAVTFPEFLKV